MQTTATTRGKRGFILTGEPFKRHLVAILLIIFYEQCIVALMMGKIFIADAAFSYAVDVPFFYLISLTAIPYWTGFRKHKTSSFLLLLGLLLSYGALSAAAQCLLLRHLHKPPTGLLSEGSGRRLLARFLHLMLIAFAWYHAREGIRKAAMGEREKSIRIGLENVNYKSQVSTHFLFNTLWFVYTRVAHVSDRAAEALLLLSRLMRYSLKAAASSGLILMRDELAHVRDYIELMRIRTDDDFCLDLNLDIALSAEHLEIPPGIFSNFIENVFKHGILNDKDDPARIVVTVIGRTLKLHTRNLKSPSPAHESTGMGLKQMVSVLDHWYKHRYDLAVKETGTHYELDFSIQL